MRGGLYGWAEGLRWTLTVAEAERVAETLAPIGIGVEISGDHRDQVTT